MLDQEDRDRLIRIDERTAHMERSFCKHVEQDREDFKEVHHRINLMSNRLNWMLGVFAGFSVLAGIVGAFVKIIIGA